MAKKQIKGAKEGRYAKLLASVRKDIKTQPLVEDTDGFWILPADRRERAALLTRIFKDLPVETFTQKMEVMKAKARMPKATLYRMAESMDWKRYAKESAETREMRELAELLGTPSDVSLMGLAQQTKQFMYMAVMTSSNIVRHCGRMVNFYALKLEALIMKSDGIDNFSAADRAMFDHFEAKLLYYKEQLTPFINTQALTRGLTMIGVSADLGDALNDVEGGAMTPAALQKRLVEQGMGQLQRIPGPAGGYTVSDKSFEDVVGDTVIPDMDGRMIHGTLHGVPGTYEEDDHVDATEMTEPDNDPQL